MDDLLGEEWQKPPKPTAFTAPSNPTTFASNYSSFRASPQPPQSGTASPLSVSRPSSTVNGSKSPANDTFGNLLSLKTQKAPGSGLSMLERQRQLLEEKKKQQEQQAQLWDSLGSGRGTPEIRQPSSTDPGDEDDILAAFNKDAPVNKASHFAPPPPSGPVSGTSTPALPPLPSRSMMGNGDFDDDDDPFGLNSVPKQGKGRSEAPAAPAIGDDDEDILGELGKPVSEIPRRKPESQPLRHQEEQDMPNVPPRSDRGDVPKDQALAELIDMGFPADTAAIALAENDGNVQNAVGWLLHQAHEESRQKSRGQTQQRGSPAGRSPVRQQREDRDSTPAWMKQEGRPNSAIRKQNTASPANGERDPTQVAQELGSKFLKSANSLWKASQKQMAKTVAEFQQDTDQRQPKWLRDTSTDSSRADSAKREERVRASPAATSNWTDEAAMLDAPRERPQKPLRPSMHEQPMDLPSRGRSPVEPFPHRPSPQPKFMQQAPTQQAPTQQAPTQQAPTQQDRRPITKLRREDVEEQTAQAYISPARRKRPVPKAEPQTEPEVDLFSSAPAQPLTGAVSTNPIAKTTQAPSLSRPSPVPSTQKAPPRNIPSIAPSALSTSASHRKAGGEHFKRGDYAAAHESYTAALTPLPPTHPIAIIVLSNRSLTALKTGDAKVAVADADRALEIIGPGFGAGEIIELSPGEGTKDMKEFHGKALMRKAEALEHLEKYSEAASVWRHAVELGVGGAVSLKGRNRCEKAAAPNLPSAPSSKPTRSVAPGTGRGPPSKSLGKSAQRPAIASGASTEAVKKLRQANAAAEKADDEKFALTDQVDAKLTAWKGGKADNLRALLQSMETVLWEGAGWKKVGMSDLVIPNKVKIIYMKAIAKVHPDKIPQNATTEQRMISAAVFATLNEAWDKFKKDNNL